MKYSTILADPPWPYHSPKAVVGNGGRGNPDGRASLITQTNVLQHYPVMSIEQLKNLQIPSNDNAHLYLWTTNSFMVEAHEIAQAWGFKPKTILTWVKIKKDGTPSKKTGYWYRSSTEHVLFCVKGKLRLQSDRTFPTAFLWPRLPHSVKPEEFYEVVEEASPGPYLELFARRRRENWHVWGNEVESDLKIT